MSMQLEDQTARESSENPIQTPGPSNINYSTRAGRVIRNPIFHSPHHIVVSPTQPTRKRPSNAASNRRPHVYSIPDVIPSLDNIATNFDDVEDCVNDDKTIDYSRAPAMIVVRSQGSLFRYSSNKRIRAVNFYEAQLASSCYEGRRAQKAGSWHTRIEIPGIPTRKFNNEDLEDQGTHVDDWSIQDIFINPAKRSECMVSYLGWTTASMETNLVRDIKGTSEELLKTASLRETFLKTLLQFDESLEPWIQRELFPQRVVRNNEHHRMWLYRDLSYYHSELHADYGSGPVQYFCLIKTQVPPPNFAYSMVNVLHEDVYQRCLAHPANQTIGEIEPGVVRTRSAMGACENLDGCKCNYRAQKVYSANDRASNGIRLLHHNQHGILNVDAFTYEGANIVVECSDACGCNPHTCPRRQLQRGKGPGLAVVHDTAIGFYVAAMEVIKKGSLITEYIGEHIFLKPKETAPKSKKARRVDWTVNPIGFRIDNDMKEEMLDIHKNCYDEFEEDEEVEFIPTGRTNTYEAQCGVMDPQILICAEKVGNVARFLSHSCDPSAAFIETYSRRVESDPYCVRIGVYALKDIQIGERVSIQYYRKQDMTVKTSVPCGCKKDCPNFLPQ